MAVYTIFGQSGGGALQSDSGHYTLGMQFTVSLSCTLTGIWWNSPAGAAVLPSECGIWLKTGTGTGTLVSGSDNNSPSWSGAAGSGWVRCPYPSGPTLSPGNTYKVAVQLPAGNTHQYGATANYWTSGPGSAGLVSGILTAQNNAGGDGGQDTLIVTSTFKYPTTSASASNYWIDVEVFAALVQPLVPPPQIPPGFRSPSSVFFAWRRGLQGATNIVSTFTGAIAATPHGRGLFSGPQLINYAELPGPVDHPISFASPDYNVPFLGQAAASGKAASASARQDPFTGRLAVSGHMAGTKTSDTSVTGPAAATGTGTGVNLGIGGMNGPSAVSGTAAGTTTRLGAFTGPSAVSGETAGSTPTTGLFAGAAAASGKIVGAEPVVPLLLQTGTPYLTWQFSAPR